MRNLVSIPPLGTTNDPPKDKITVDVFVILFLLFYQIALLLTIWAIKCSTSSETDFLYFPSAFIWTIIPHTIIHQKMFLYFPLFTINIPEIISRSSPPLYSVCKYSLKTSQQFNNLTI